MRKNFFVFALLLALIFPAYAETVFFMQPITKEIKKSDAKEIVKNLEATVNAKLDVVSYKDVPKKTLKKFGACGMKAEWIPPLPDRIKPVPRGHGRLAYFPSIFSISGVFSMKKLRIFSAVPASG